MNDEVKSKIVRFILGLSESLEITGHPLKAASLSEAVQSSKNLLDRLSKNESIENIQQAIDRKRVAVERWKNLTGEKWLL